ncbi:glycosyltransferase family 2 protein [Geobacter metallireducens]|nr:glycosyltransferase family 2 protein [Geobacter metallireducens]
MLKLSVAICTYNGERFLREQLDSIARQTRLPDELILCDDGSSDRTLQIIDNFASSAPFEVKSSRNVSNIGSTKNFERAIGLCDGDIIALSDQDDVWHRDKLEVIERAFLDAPLTGAVFTNGAVVGDDLSPLGYTLWDTFRFKKKQQSCFKKGRALEVLLNHDVVTGATMAFRSALRDIVVPIPVEWVHDAWIALLTSIYSKIDFIDKNLIDYRQHSNQQIGSVKKNFTDHKNVAQSITDYYAQISKYEMLLDHIRCLNQVPNDYAIGKLHDKIEHMEVRNSICTSPKIIKTVEATCELLNRRYHNYSNGYFSFCKDIFWGD